MKNKEIKEFYGIPEIVYEKIKNIIYNNCNYKFLLFGSRARGDYSKTSDIDIAIFENVNDKEKFKIIDEFDSLDIIYKIDLVFINENTNQELIKCIERDGKEF